MFTDIGAVIFYVEEQDLLEAAKWYQKLTGRRPISKRDKFVTFEVAGMHLGLHVANEKASPGTNGQTAYWLVDDIKAASKRLDKLGAVAYRRILEIPEGEGGFVTQFKDPFGNVIGLIERPK